MRFETLAQWLAWQETLHTTEIELGLARIAPVWRRLHPTSQLPFPVITVAGTNGKGSTVAMLESMLSAGGYRVGCFTSPHLLRYNERIKLDGVEATDETLCAAFERVDQAREETTLTYFEFSALAALAIFVEARPDAVVLEVGLGGRLDATNIVDPDLALITTIAIDHTAWLGDTLEQIAAEKAGIMRASRPTVYAGAELPRAIETRAHRLGSPLYCAGRDYRFENDATGWHWRSGDLLHEALPLPAMQGRYQLRNAAGVIMALELLRSRLPLSRAAIERGLQSVRLRGRFQLLRQRPLTVLDVAHNAQAAQQLAATLRDHSRGGLTRAVFGIMHDKEVDAVIAPLLPEVDQWHLVDLKVARAMPPEHMRGRLLAAGVEEGRIVLHDDIGEAWSAASSAAEPDDRLVAFGSFWLVGDLLRLIDSRGDGGT
ncbi:MAG: bifunctional tetrahydrofolate synthase/dihydrofolate synthase [Gammaproteobacteria bacterium]|nr:bifunctional tetrahydrofolate synthase/dihydrofolate synthase [Gammaproteobacteria bacterium]